MIKQFDNRTVRRCLAVAALFVAGGLPASVSRGDVNVQANKTIPFTADRANALKVISPIFVPPMDSAGKLKAHFGFADGAKTTHITIDAPQPDGMPDQRDQDTKTKVGVTISFANAQDATSYALGVKGKLIPAAHGGGPGGPRHVMTWAAKENKQPKTGGLIISTIAANANWPGTRPAGIVGRLGYPAGANPSNDQILLDVVLNIHGGLADVAVNIANAILGLRGEQIQTPTAGSLTNAKPADKQWLTLLLLSHSTNPPPMNSFTLRDLDKLQNGSGVKPEWRLIDELSFASTIQGGKLASAIVQLREQHAIGPTPFKLANANYDILVKNKKTMQITATHLQLGLTAFVGGNTADEADKNGEMTGGKTGDTSVTHRTAGRIGPALAPYERAMLPLRPPPFFSTLIFTINNNAWVMTDDESLNAQHHWPTAYVYKWNKTKQQYVRQNTRKQDNSPFDNFIPAGTQWPH